MVATLPGYPELKLVTASVTVELSCPSLPSGPLAPLVGHPQPKAQAETPVEQPPRELTEPTPTSAAGSKLIAVNDSGAGCSALGTLPAPGSALLLLLLTLGWRRHALR